jgi:hypothetical protein
MKGSMKAIKLFALFCALGVPTLGVFGQSTASLAGTVTDPSGAVIANAHVVVHSIDTGADRAIDTNDAGLYAVPSLQPGDYRIQATAPGFSTYTVSKVTLNVAQTATVNLHLAVSSSGETVEVTSVGTQIESQSITVGQTVQNTTVQQLPLNGRHFLDLTILTPGGVVANASGNLTAPIRGMGASSFITAGNREDSVNFQINGVNLNDITQNQITFQPSISTTSEFKVINSTFSAEYGRSDGSVVSVVTKSGGSQYHGEAFDYARNEALDARNYYNRSNSPVTGLPLGVPGAKAPLKRNNFGGAAGGPIWRDHIFVYGSYEGLRQHQGLVMNSPVISNADRAAIAANKANAPVAAALTAMLPAPNSGNNYVGLASGPVQIDQYTGDVLHNIGKNDTLHGFYAFQSDMRTEPNLQGDTVPGWGDFRNSRRQIVTLSETHIFNSNMVNEARAGFNRLAIAFRPANTTDPSSIGIGNGLKGPVGLPMITLTDLNLVFGGPSAFPQGRTDTAGVVADTLSLLRNKHSIKVGGEFRRYLVANYSNNIGTITYATSIGPTSLFQQDKTTAFAVQTNQTTLRIYANAIGGFVQDNYKVSPNITLELGLRYEWNGSPVEGANRFAVFNPTAVTLTQVGTNGLGRNPYSQNNNIEPRVGFAWDLLGNGRSVLRGGYGYLVDQPVANILTGLGANPPFAKSVSYSGSAIPVGTLMNNATAAGISLAWVNPHYKNAYIESYNLNLQQALPYGLVAQVYYAGSLGRHLLLITNANQIIGGVSTNRPYLTLSASSPVAPGQSIASNINERNSIGSSNYNALWTVLSKNMGKGLEFNMNYTWSKSMDINSLGSQGTYSLADSTRPALNYGTSDFDVRSHIAAHAVYNLPFKGNRLVEGFQLSGIMQWQTGNPVNVVTSSTYNGLSTPNLIRPTLVGHYVVSKQQVASQTNVTWIQNPSGTVCTTLASGCVFQIPSGGYGTMMGRNTIYGPGFTNLDISAEKDTRLISERLNFKLRVDVFDILNHPNFGQPTANVQSSSFGQITSTRFPTGDSGSSRQLQLSGKFVF